MVRVRIMPRIPLMAYTVAWFILWGAGFVESVLCEWAGGAAFCVFALVLGLVSCVILAEQFWRGAAWSRDALERLLSEAHKPVPIAPPRR